MLTILIYLCFALMVISVVTMLGFGVLNAGRLGADSKLGLVAIALPLVSFVVAFLVTGSWIAAGVWTALVVGLATVVSLLVSGTRNLLT